MNENQRSSRTHRDQRQVPWICQQCGRSAYPGWVQITYSEIHRRRDELAAWKARYPDGQPLRTADLMSHPERAAWEVICRRCDDRRRESGVEDDEFYSFATERAATFAELLDWCAHLSEKTWMDDTNWSSVLRRLSKAAAAR